MSDTEQTKKEKKRKLLIIILSVGIVICLAVTVWALVNASVLKCLL